MINDEPTKLIRIYVASYPSLEADLKEFQNKIGGGKWSIADTVRERNKILGALKEDVKLKEFYFNKHSTLKNKLTEFIKKSRSDYDYKNTDEPTEKKNQMQAVLDFIDELEKEIQ